MGEVGIHVHLEDAVALDGLFLVEVQHASRIEVQLGEPAVELIGERLSVGDLVLQLDGLVESLLHLRIEIGIML